MMKPLPVPRPVTLRTVQPNAEHVLLAQHDGKPATLTAITRDCGPDGSFYCEITAPYLPYPWNVSGRFLEGADLCDARDEAWQQGKYTPPEEAERQDRFNETLRFTAQ